MKEAYVTLRKKMNIFKPFLESYCFMGILSILTVFCYYFEMEYVSYVLLSIVVILISLSGASYITLPNIFFMFNASAKHTVPNLANVYFWIVMVFVLIAAISFVVDIFQRPLLQVNNDRILGCLFIMTCIMMLSMVNAPNLVESGSEILLFGVNIVLYVLMAVAIPKDDERFDRFVISMIFIGFSLFVEVGISFFRLYPSSGVGLVSFISSKQMSLSWCNLNHYAMLSIIVLYLSFYYYVVKQDIRNRCIALGSVFINLVVLFTSSSRGAYLALGLTMPFVIYMYIKYTKNWKKEIPILSIVGIGIVGILIISLKLHLFQSLKSVISFDDHGRFPIYAIARRNFKEYPFLGTGWGSSHYYIKLYTGEDVYNYHNIFYQVFSTIGLIGGITFLIFLVLVGIHLWDKNIKSMIGLCIMVYLLLHGLFDTTFFNPLIMPFFIMLLPLVKKEQSELEEQTL